MGFEIDWRLVLQVVSGLFGVVASVLVFMLARVFVKKEPFEALEKRVQSVEQTYVPKKDVDVIEKRVLTVEKTYAPKNEVVELSKRMTRLETATNELPTLVRNLNEKVIRIEATAQHFDETIKRIEHPLNLIVEAAMRAK